MTLSADEVVSRFNDFKGHLSDSGFDMPECMVAAVAHIQRQRTTFQINPGLCADIAKRLVRDKPGWQGVTAWLQSTGQPDDTILQVLWISGHTVSEWIALPKLTRSQHRDLYGRIESITKELVSLLMSTQERYVRGGGHGLRSATVPDLMTDEQLAELHEVSGGFDIHYMEHFFPYAEEIIETLGHAAARLRDSGPPHPQPGKRGARNGFVVRHLKDTLTAAFGSVPDEVLATLANAALDLNDIDAGLVRKLYR